ncbi:hypothetical protein FRB94_012105 [Tulasnella sp. JGI-2019a]|nr:hypothetical protein FRB94_012105 [Tulasnella sp. JGI-2019a]
MPFINQIDAAVTELPVFTICLYTTYNTTENNVRFDDYGVMAIGLKFDWCTVRENRTLHDQGMKAVIIQRLSTLTTTVPTTCCSETILDIYAIEQSRGIIFSP